MELRYNIFSAVASLFGGGGGGGGQSYVPQAPKITAPDPTTVKATDDSAAQAAANAEAAANANRQGAAASLLTNPDLGSTFKTIGTARKSLLGG